MYEFLCKEGHRTERFTAYETQETLCDCGNAAKRVISAPSIKLEGWSGNFPSEHGRFERKHLEKLAAERKQTS